MTRAIDALSNQALQRADLAVRMEKSSQNSQGL
jgi:hypothetical protein